MIKMMEGLSIFHFVYKVQLQMKQLSLRDEKYWEERFREKQKNAYHLQDKMNLFERKYNFTYMQIQ